MKCLSAPPVSATVADGGRISTSLVDAEIQRLKWPWHRRRSALGPYRDGMRTMVMFCLHAAFLSRSCALHALWRVRVDSNHRPRPSESRALAAELRTRKWDRWQGGRIRTCVRRVKAGCLRPLDDAPFDLQGLPRTLSHASSRRDCCRRKQPVVMQHALKGPRRPADARVVATELLAKFLVAVDDAVPALDAGFGREAVAPLTGLRES